MRSVASYGMGDHDMADHEATIERYFEELFNEGDLEVAEEIFADEFEYHGPPSFSPPNLKRPEQFKAFVKRYHEAFPDINYHVERVFGDGDEYAVRWEAEGTHTEALFGIEGTGKSFTDEGLNMFQFEDGKIVAVWSHWDTLGMVRELGLAGPVGLTAKQQD